MNQRLLSSVIRKLLPEMIIGVALASLAYFLFTKPMIAAAAEANAKADALTGQLALLQQSPAEAPSSDPAVAIEALAAAIAARSDTTRDPGVFFEHLSNLAAPLDVQIDQVNPSTPRPLRTPDGRPATSQPIPQQPALQGPQAPGSMMGSPGPGPAGPQGFAGPASTTAPGSPAASPFPSAPPAPADTRTAFSIRITGEFSRCLMLIEKLQSDLAFTTIKSVSFTPASDDKPGFVFATIETDHIAAAPAALKPPTPAPINSPGVMTPGPLSEGPRP